MHLMMLMMMMTESASEVVEHGQDLKPPSQDWI